MTSLIAPPRFVRRNSTSELLSVSDFSVDAGTDSAGEGVAVATGAGVTEADGAVAVDSATGDAAGGATACTRAGGTCVALFTREEKHQGARIEARSARRNHSSLSSELVARAAAGCATSTSQNPRRNLV